MPNSLYSDLCDVYDEGKKPYLFISYAHEDTTKVVAAIRGLQRLGYRIWYDMGISAGAQWPEDVADHIFGCDAVLAFMTPNSIQSDNCREELFYAKKCNKKVLLAYLEKCDLTHGMDMRLGMLQAIERWRCKDDEEFYTRLAKAKNLQLCRGENLAANPDTVPEPAPQPKPETKTPKTKIEQLREKAEKGDVNAQVDLGWAYEKGINVKQDYKEALKWYHKAADQSNLWAINQIGLCHSRGNGVVASKPEAFEWYMKAAKQGYSWAQYNVGVYYERGYAVKRDPSKAVEWYQKASDQENADAINNLGVCYEKGEGTSKDTMKAFDLYRKAANMGNYLAAQNLGKCYEFCKGTQQDWEQAVFWYRKAADHGYAYAQKKLAQCYREGLGVPVDLDEAAKWQKKYDENPNKK